MLLIIRPISLAHFEHPCQGANHLLPLLLVRLWLRCGPQSGSLKGPDVGNDGNRNASVMNRILNRMESVSASVEALPVRPP